ncbi:glycoside hydrolase family 2 protein [Actinoplanes awajinensis]|uniref:beta-mannosidase n=1 Tax=Actinoplanes awajinensis subsp. mycoplanecinus TaxID=135947 RepID=A0A117MPK1_9ACTN|nr:glycoside hydrolase family 2 TIM barrel-domain containing protein [Actinoplanes awajinensis]KUL28732.1 beta-mannosidase [Actinoplanes awajinensis subsp. mycoplanecinus]
MISKQDLGGAWTLRGADHELPATVPGCVHTDLLAAGAIPDPFLDDNETTVGWVGRADWAYRRDIAWDGPAHERVDLVFDGLDTVAAVALGGTPLGATRNMHRGYRYDVTALLDGSPQPLDVLFTSAYTEAERVRELLGERANAYPEPFNFIRKMACSFGWDWGPTLVTAGIWRPVRLEGWSVARLATVRPLATWSDGAGRLDLTIEAERLHDVPLSVRVLLDGREVARGELPPGDSRLSLSANPDFVRQWAPIGYGSQPLHDLTVELSTGDVLLDRWQRRTGFRGVSIDRGPDAAGSRFVIEINGEPVLVKGVNWIPDDIFPARMTRARYELRLREAVAAGVNLIRVWGGGIYEDRAFYEVCDELGLLVWQDFLFACADYPEEEPLFSEVVAEARENVTRLAPHPSLITWSGNNENLWLHGAMGWSDEASWGERYYLETLPAIVADLDPSRPYQAGSPWSGSWDHLPNDTGHGTFHSWEVWNREDYLNYRDSAPRFVAEFGWQAPPAWTTLRDAVSDDPMLPDSPGVLHHQKAEDGNGKLARGLAPHFGTPSSTEAWHYLTQLNQVRAIRAGVEHWRSYWPHTGGSILWQLNDLWPVTSWAAIDGAGRYKPLYFELASLHAARGLTVQPRDGGLVVAVLNDSPAGWAGRLAVHRRTTGGELRAAWAVPVEVAARQVTLVEIPRDVTAIGDGEFLVAELDQARALWFAVPDKDFPHPDAALTVTADPVPGGLDVLIRADGLARDVLLQADRIHPEAVADRGFLTLLPGESATVRVRGPVELDPALVKAPWVVTDLATVLAGDE